VQPLIRLLISVLQPLAGAQRQQKQVNITHLKQIRSPEYRPPRKVPRVHTHDQHLLAPHLGQVLRNVLRVSKVVVHADEGRTDVGLLAQMREAEARQRGRVVEDRGLVFGCESGREGVSRLRGAALDAIDEVWDGCGWGGGGKEVGCGLSEEGCGF